MKTNKKHKQHEITFLFDVEWRYLSGPRGFDCVDSGVTTLEATTAEDAERQWKISHCYAQRKFMVVSVTESPNQTNKQAKQTNATREPNNDIPSGTVNKRKVHRGAQEKRPRQPVGTSKEHGDWDDIPDF